MPSDHETPIVIDYTNWEGFRRHRAIVPIKIFFGSNEWHPKPCWLLLALDIEKRAERTFAMNNVHEWRESPDITKVLKEIEHWMNQHNNVVQPPGPTHPPDTRWCVCDHHAGSHHDLKVTSEDDQTFYWEPGGGDCCADGCPCKEFKRR
jgi:hypothetical protein